MCLTCQHHSVVLSDLLCRRAVLTAGIHLYVCDGCGQVCRRLIFISAS